MRIETKASSRLSTRPHASLSKCLQMYPKLRWYVTRLSEPEPERRTSPDARRERRESVRAPAQMGGKPGFRSGGFSPKNSSSALS